MTGLCEEFVHRRRYDFISISYIYGLCIKPINSGTAMQLIIRARFASVYELVNYDLGRVR